MPRSFWFRLALILILLPCSLPAQERLRVIVETDAGGDPDDEQSMVRFLLYANEWDVEGIIANRPVAREKENRNRERTGLGIVRAMVNAYGQCYPRLVLHDRRYPPPEMLAQLTVAGYDDVEDGVNLIIKAVDDPDPRPVWFCNWGTDSGSAARCLKRALDRVLRQRGPDGYARFKNRLRLSSADKFQEHTGTIDPPWVIWVDTFRPELDKRRWYHRFSAITARAGGFDIERDVRTGHGPLGELYPTNTGIPQKEGDTMSFLYLVPTGMNDPEHPDWGSWAGRYGLMESAGGKAYYWANQMDTWRGTTHRDNTLARWAEHLQNDFAARMDWCVKDYARANHPPLPANRGIRTMRAAAGERVTLDGSGWIDPDRNRLDHEWIWYPEPGTYRGEPIEIVDARSPEASFTAPQVTQRQTLHFVQIVTDSGTPRLTRYQRVVVTVEPR